METNPVFLGVTAEHTGGKITYHNETDDVSVSYKDVDYEANFTMVNEAVSKFAEKLGGTFLKNLLWSECLGKSVVTVHPLGGCPMAESGQTGVVNHAGQVFEGTWYFIPFQSFPNTFTSRGNSWPHIVVGFFGVFMFIFVVIFLLLLLLLFIVFVVAIVVVVAAS